MSPGMKRLTNTSTAARFLLVPVLTAALALPAATQTRIEPRKNSIHARTGRPARAAGGRRSPRSRCRCSTTGRTDAFVERIGGGWSLVIPARVPPARSSSTRSTSSTCARSTRSRCPAGRCSSTAACSRRRRTDDEVAGVMAHELSHVVLRHGTRRRQRRRNSSSARSPGRCSGRSSAARRARSSRRDRRSVSAPTS